MERSVRTVVKWFPPPKMTDEKEELNQPLLSPITTLSYIVQTKNRAPNPSKTVERMTPLEKRRTDECFSLLMR